MDQRGQIDRQIDKDCDQIVVNCTCDSTQRYTKCVGGPAYLIYGMRALAPHCEYHKAQSCNKQNSLSMFGSALRISGEKPDSDLRTEHASGSAHKSTLGVPNRASIFVNHFAASVSDSTYLVH